MTVCGSGFAPRELIAPTGVDNVRMLGPTLLSDVIMPDGDKLHNNLPGQYQKAYEWLCQGEDVNVVVREFERGLKSILQNNGDEVLEFMQNLPHQLRGPLFEQDTSKQEIIVALERRARQIAADPRNAALAVKASKFVVNTYWNKERSSADVVELACRKYVEYVFEASCTSRIQNTDEHHLGVPHSSIASQMAEVKDNMLGVYERYGILLANHGNTDKLRISPTQNEDTRDLLAANLDQV